MVLDWFWVGLIGLTGVAAAIGLNHALLERRWARQRADDQARQHPAE